MQLDLVHLPNRSPPLPACMYVLVVLPFLTTSRLSSCLQNDRGRGRSRRRAGSSTSHHDYTEGEEEGRGAGMVAASRKAVRERDAEDQGGGGGAGGCGTLVLEAFDLQTALESDNVGEVKGHLRLLHSLVRGSRWSLVRLRCLCVGLAGI